MAGSSHDTAGAGLTSATSLELFEPIVRLDHRQKQRLEQGEVVVRILPAEDRQLAVFSAGRVDVSGACSSPGSETSSP